ncbi:VOC family virulence protein [Photobacterium gaetbulicola]|uniref:Methylmalonyl CoA epimerase n=1 Tax=Photobacterium gaetbulicola Gung47 TaxID=658445 RepID=A0A0C5WC61_9GAMM|nr:VOC family protein [Photobacterium gaetbulicola]AJR09231.1 methylmalonyl CoA epimerase [Photobacterium gaetbulicola Gung47]PSU11722.1 VOC family virulence protein [Photobacterium gaetbulicola]
MITLEGIDHVVLRTTKLPDMLHFYCQVLGAKLERELPKEMGLVQLRAGSALIDLVTVDSQLGQLGGKPPSQDGRNVDHFCLQIAPVSEQALLEYLSQHNISCEGFAERYGAEGFGRSIYIQDPEGNVVELKLKC